jgi:tetratricopeptide (TPR) repeat protein
MLERYSRLHTIHLSLFFLLAVQLMPAQPGPTDNLHAANALRERGEYQRALAILEPMVQSGGSDAGDVGTAWVLLGNVYQDIGRYSDAQRAFQNAISIFKDQGKERDEAAALDNLGSVYLAIGQPEMSKRLRLRVLKAIEKYGDHASLARLYNNLAATAFELNDVNEGRKYIGKAFQEVKLAPDAVYDDLAAIFSNAGSLSMHDHDYKKALEYYDQARGLWIKQHGMNHPQTGWGYVLCGRARGLLGEAQQGLEDVRTGLSMIENTVGTHVSVYYTSRVAYADALAAAGSRKESKAVRAAALLSLQSFLRGKASQSVISADAFR